MPSPRVILLDGSDPLYEWVDEPGARDPGLVPFDEMPQLERSDFVFNANDPFWFVNPDELLSGYSPAHGLELTPVSNRTRMNARQLSADGGDAGTDGLFTRESSDSRVPPVFTPRCLVDAVVAECTATPPWSAIRNGICSPSSTRWRMGPPCRCRLGRARPVARVSSIVLVRVA